MGNAAMKIVSGGSGALPPERVALAEAIAVKDAAVAEAASATRALEELEDRLNETRRLWAMADDALAAARKLEAEMLSRCGGDERAVVRECVREGRPVPKEAIKSAEGAVAETRRHLDLGNDGHLRAGAAEEIAAEKLNAAEDRLVIAVSDVELTVARQLLDEAAAMQSELVRRRFVLLRLAADPKVKLFGSSRKEEPRVLGELRAFLADHRIPSTSMGTFTHQAGIEAASCAPWKASHEALQRDASAPLPRAGGGS